MSQEMISPILKPMFGDMFGPIMGGGGAPPAPTIVSQTILSDGVTLRLVGSAALTAGSLTGFSAPGLTLSSAAIVGDYLHITIAKVYDDQPVGDLTYDGTGTLAGADGAVAAFGPVAISNASEEPITSISGTLDLLKWNDLTRLHIAYNSATPVSAVGDPVGWWRGQLDAYTLETTATSARGEYQTDGILFNSTSATKNLFASFAQAATAPFFICVRAVTTSPVTSAVVGAYFGSSGADTVQHGLRNGASSGNQLGVIRNLATESPTEGQGDVCSVLSFNGTSAFLIDNDGVKTTLTVGTGGSAIAYLKIRAQQGALGVSSIKYMQAGTAAISEANARAWIAWAKGQA